MEGWIMSDIRMSTMVGGIMSGTTAERSTKVPSPSIGDQYYNGTLGVLEIYTSSGWLPATGANDFNVTLNGTVTTATFTKEYFAGAYTIASALLDSTYDIYVYNTAGDQVGYTKSPSLNATGNFNKIVVVGGTAGDLLSFSYKTTFTATNTTGELKAGAFITSATPTALNSIDDTTVITGGNFASNVAVYFVGSDNTERAAKSVVRSSSSSLIVTRPDDFPTNLGTYKLIVENPGITRPTGSSLHILNNAVTAGTTPNWSTSTTLPEVGKNIAYSTTLVATDTEGTDIDYSIASGSLPSGITLNNETGVLSGTYTGADFNTTNLVIRAVDTGGNTVDRTFTIYQSTPVLLSAPSGTYYSGVAYSSTLSVQSSETLTYSILSGSLPSGLSLNASTGLVSGTPSGSTSSTVVFKATDVVGNFTTATVNYISDLNYGARIYAPLSNSNIYNFGVLSGSTVDITGGSAVYTNDSILSKNVLAGVDSGNMKIKVPTLSWTPGSNTSVSIWSRTNPTGSHSRGMLLSKFATSSDTTDGPGLDLWDGGGGANIYANTGDGAGNPFSGTTSLDGFNTSTWRHYVVTHDGSTIRLYINGSYVGSAPTYQSWSGRSGSWVIGSWAGSEFGNYDLQNNRFSKFAAFDSTLNSTQISNLYAVGA
jgi:hypothetical protein